MTSSLPLCQNCGQPAAYVWTLDNGDESTACGTCRPHAGVSVREVGAEPAQAVVADAPLTVEEAAEREKVHPRTVYRWLAEGVLEDGAWQTGGTSGHWRIDPAALDRRRTLGPRTRAQPSATKSPQQPKVRAKSKKPANPTAWRKS